MSSEGINQTPDELKTAVSELTRNISRLAVAQTNSTVLQCMMSHSKKCKNSSKYKIYITSNEFFKPKFNSV